MGGEKTLYSGMHRVVLGSPPRGRGKEQSSNLQETADRITPAWAGKRSERPARSNSDEDHPRVGGEKFSVFHLHRVCKGSPPRGRGKVQFSRSTSKQRGITPAWAGKRTPINESSFTKRDHPRVGGEKIHIILFSFSSWGSPPRGRGKARFSMMPTSTSRITPAWAGKRSCLSCWPGLVADHPRVGGEKTKKIP